MMSEHGVKSQRSSFIVLLDGRGTALCYEASNGADNGLLPTLEYECLDSGDELHTDSEVTAGERARSWRCGRRGPSMRERLAYFVDFLSFGRAQENDDDDSPDEIPGATTKLTRNKKRPSCKQRKKLWQKRLCYSRRWILHRGKILTFGAIVVLAVLIRRRKATIPMQIQTENRYLSSENENIVFAAEVSATVAGTSFPCFPFDDLDDTNVSSSIYEAFSPRGAGLICITFNETLQQNISQIRNTFLPMAHQLTQLPAELHKSLLDQGAMLTNGLSRGNEGIPVSRSGYPGGNRTKSSFYYHPLTDDPAADLPDGAERIPAFHNPNCFPSESDIPGFKQESRNAAQLVELVGYRIARLIEQQLPRRVHGYKNGSVESAVRLERGSNHKCGLFFFHPFEDALQRNMSEGLWAGHSHDIAMLVGTVPGVFLDRHGHVAESPDAQTGLYILDRNCSPRKVEVPTDLGEVLLYWGGESLLLASGGELKATPNFVKGPQIPDPGGVGYSSLVIYMQHPTYETLAVPLGMSDIAISNRSGDFCSSMNWPSLRGRLQMSRRNGGLQPNQLPTFGMFGNFTFFHLAHGQEEL